MEQPGAGADAEQARAFRLGFVPGATPAKWGRVFTARHPEVRLELVPVPAAAAERAVRAGELDAAVLRPPVDREALHAVSLYVEESVVVVDREHLLAALEEHETVAHADLAEEVLLRPADDVLHWAGEPGAAEDALPPPGCPAAIVPATTKEAVELVAAGVGVLVVPRSLARLHHRKDVTARVLEGAPPGPVVLAWLRANEDPLVEDLVGIVRGRTVNSSRGVRGTVPQEQRARRRPDDAAPPRRGRRGAAGRGRRR